MIKVNLNKLDLTEFSAKDGGPEHCHATFPLFGAHGTKSTATVYFELQPGDALGRHTDSEEELLLVLEGEVEAEVGGEKAPLAQGEIALVPKMVPHNLVNKGNGTARVLGFFGGANHIIATFEKTWLPIEGNMVDTSQLAG